MNIGIKGVFGILIFIQIINGLSLGDSSEGKRHKPSRRGECVAKLKKMMTTAERKFKRLLLNQTNHTLDKLVGAEDLNNFSQANSMRLTMRNTTIVPSVFRDLLNNINGILRMYHNTCRTPMRGCRGKKIKTHKPVYCIEGKWEVGVTAYNVVQTAATFNKTKQFNVINEKPEYVNITLREGIQGEVFILHASFANATPKFECSKPVEQNVMIHVKPSVNYLICLATVDAFHEVNVLDCQPHKTKPLRGDQPWIVRKSIPTLIISVFILFVLAMIMGAFMLYLSVHRNPSLIRGGKRVLEVKRQDKAQTLIMPRGYESLPWADSPVANDVLEPAISNCDTNSTISYVSAIQPTPVEILTYRLSRLRELFNFPLSVSSIPMSISMSLNQRLPPNVDLLLEYEWYTITTTIIMTTKTEQED